MSDEDVLAARVWSDKQADHLQAWIDAGKPQTMHVPWWAPTCNPYLIDKMRCTGCGGTRTEPFSTAFTPRGALRSSGTDALRSDGVSEVTKDARESE